MGARRIAGVAIAAWLGAAAAGSAQESAAFPLSLERESLLMWLRRETDILPERVVAVTPQILTSIVSIFPASAQEGPRLVLRTEALSPETFARTGVLSWHVSLSADCPGRRVRLGETTGYASRNLLGDRRPLRDADGDWRAPEAGTALDAGWRAACEKNFKGPFQDPALKIARPERPSAPEARVAVGSPTLASSPGAVRAGAVVQVGASPSADEAQALLSALGDRVAGYSTWVETAEIAGRTWRRALVGGFADTAQAARFCATLKAAGRACFVRPARQG